MSATDSAIHGGVGAVWAAAILVPSLWLWYWFAIAIPLTIFGWGAMREQSQHSEEGWFGWWTANRAWEAASWGIGAALGTAVWMVLKLVLK